MLQGREKSLAPFMQQMISWLFNKQASHYTDYTITPLMYASILKVKYFYTKNGSSWQFFLLLHQFHRSSWEQPSSLYLWNAKYIWYISSPNNYPQYHTPLLTPKVREIHTANYQTWWETQREKKETERDTICWYFTAFEKWRHAT